MRCVSLALTAAIYGACRDAPRAFVWGTYSLGFAHYFLALRYSTRQLGQAVATAPQRLLLLALPLLSVGLYADEVTLVAYFGIHHALNEAYLRRPGAAAVRSRGWLPAAGTAFHALAYATVLRRDPGFAWVEWWWAAPALVAAGAWVVLAAKQEALPGARLLDTCASEAGALLLLAGSLFVRVAFLAVVLYHFILWALLPVDKLRARGRGALAEYVGLSVGLIGVALLLSPLGPGRTPAATAAFSQQFLFWSYAHITLSFALSDAHPAWMARLFRGSAGDAAVLPRS
ncbi:MAG: hypothetical protein U0802_09000 [Candidatus Binatia bacterium]